MKDGAKLLNEARNAFKERRLDEAMTIVQELLSQEPENAPAHYILGLIYSSTLKNNEAIRHFKQAVSLCDSDPLYFYNYGVVLQRTAHYAKAAKQYERALALKPDYAAALINYSAVMNLMGHVTKAEEAARKIVALIPDKIHPYVNLGNSLKDQGRISEAIAWFQKALSIEPTSEIAGSNMLLCLNYGDFSATKVFQEHTKWAQRIQAKYQETPLSAYDMNPRKSPLRVGYISGDFKTHSVACFIAPVLRHHNRSQFNIFCYSDVANPDPLTMRFKKLDLTWRPIHSLSNNDVSEMIRKDTIDILVDLAGHTGNNRLSLFLNRCAPAQVTYLGYPNTTGLPTMDYRLTDSWADPLGEEKWHTEKLFRLPHGFLCYNPLTEPPEVSELPALTNGFVTFGSFNNLPKINESVIQIWSQLLNTVPNAKLILKTKPFNDKNVRERIKNLFIKNGVSADTILIKEYADSTKNHLSQYHDIDIALDTFPYNGTTTTCEALWMGVPIITLAGKHHAGRVGVSLLSQIGLSGMIAPDMDQYIALASFMANDFKRLARLRKGLRNAISRSSLCNGEAFTRDLENGYREIWREKCTD